MKRAYVGVDKLKLALKRNVKELAERAESRVIDEHVDIFFPEVLIQVDSVDLVREVDRYNANVYIFNLVFKRIQLICTASADYEVIAELGEIEREFSAYSRACSCY